MNRAARPSGKAPARLAAGAVSTVLAVVGAGCSSADPPAEEPGTDATVTVLRIATNDGPDTPAGAALTYFSRTVRGLSEGSVRVDPVWEAAGNPDRAWDQAVARTVLDGDNELGYIPARAFDVLGVTTLQPLQSPFLLTSPERVEAAVRSPHVDELMSGLDDIGLVGLGLFPEDLRRLFSYGEPLTGPEDLRGRTVRAPRSDMTAAVFDSVGASVDDPTGDAWEAAVAAGDLAAAEGSLAGFAALGGDNLVTANDLVLFPKVNVLVADQEAFEELDEAQRALLREAAAVTLAWPDLATDEAEAAEAFCASGGRIVATPAATATAFQETMEGAAPSHGDPGTTRLARSLQQLVSDLPSGAPVPVCGTRSSRAAGPDAAAGEVVLVVDTQLGAPPRPGPVVEAADPFRSCVAMRDLESAVDDSDPATTRFSGAKLLSCGRARVTLAYEVSMRPDDGSTDGTWWITGSTLPEARAGSGRLRGDAATCRMAAGASACIRDTYTGTVGR